MSDSADAHTFRRAGRSRQAKAFEEEFFGNQRKKSKLAALLLDIWKWGHIPATLVQKISAAAEEDIEQAHNKQIDEWEILGKLGACGAASQNIQRDLLRKLPNPLLPASRLIYVICCLFSFFITTEIFLFSEVTQHAIPLRIKMTNASIGRTALTRLPMILPGDLWQALWDANLFPQYVVDDKHEIPKFWRQCENHPGLRNHPVKQIPHYRDYAVPVLLHGDGAPVVQQIGSASKSCLFLSWRSMVSGSNSTQFLMTAVWASACSKASGAYTSNISYSCKCLASLVGKS